MDQTNSNLLVIGAGCGRTGTASLKAALEVIYHRPCYHMFELLGAHREHAEKWIEFDDQVKQSVQPGGRPIDTQLIHDLFRGYVCAVDFPVCSYYQELMKVYPNAKIILTVRDTKTWVQSVRETILPRNNFLHNSWIVRTMYRMTWGSEITQLEERMWSRICRSKDELKSDQLLGEAFDRWNEAVKQTVPNDKLLVFRVKDGWEPLCRFLQVPIPLEPFPKFNARAEFAQNIAVYENSTIFAYVGWPMLIVVSTALFGCILYYRRKY